MDQKHHVIPLSLGGYDMAENLISVTEKNHKLIHSTLNVPYDWIRTFRKRTNHIIVNPDEKYVHELRKLHLEYFKNIGSLPQHLQEAHRRAMIAMVLREIHLNDLSQHIEFQDGNSFQHYLNQYHNILILRIRKVTQKLKSK